MSASFNGDLLDGRQHYNPYDMGGDGDDGPICVPALISPPRPTDADVDLSPPDIGMASLDFDPMSFQCSLPLTESSAISPDKDPISHRESPGSASGSEPVSPVRTDSPGRPPPSPDLDPSFEPSKSSEKIRIQFSESCPTFAKVALWDARVVSQGPESPVHASPPHPLHRSSSEETSTSVKSAEDFGRNEAPQIELLFKSASRDTTETKRAAGTVETQQPCRVGPQEQTGES